MNWHDFPQGLLLLVLFLCLSSAPAAHCTITSIISSYADLRGHGPYEVSFDSRSLIVNNSRVLLQSGAVHYPRSTPALWPTIISLAKLQGLNTIEFYTFWNYHALSRENYDFSTESRDIVGFLRAISDAGMFAILRLGPYICGEYNYGGIPLFLRQELSIFRSNDYYWRGEMASWLNRVIELVEPFLAKRGGPIILAQVENEYGSMENFYPDHALYISWAVDYMKAKDLGIPTIMCVQDDAPSSVINTCNGFYCDNWIENHNQNFPNQPNFWTELWDGWFQHWGEPSPHRPVADMAFSMARFYAKGGSLINLYMFQGGTNFGRSSGGPNIITSYDYDAPVDEFGSINPKKFYHLAEFCAVLAQYSAALLSNSVPAPISLGFLLEAHIYGAAHSPNSIIFLSNIGENSAQVLFLGQKFTLPAWSVLILDGQNLKIVFNTAEFSQNSEKMVRVHEHHEISKRNRPELAQEVQFYSENVSKPSNFSQISVPMEQLTLGQDKSDYLRYSTSIVLDENQLSRGQINVSLAVSVEFLYFFLDSEFVGQFNASTGLISAVLPLDRAKFGPGEHQLTIISVLMGLINFGPYLESVKKGILGSISVDSVLDLSETNWNHSIGLSGEEIQLFSPAVYKNFPWNQGSSGNFPPFTWYKLEIASPAPRQTVRNEPPTYHLNAFGYKKGQIWVNGHSLGRFWTVFAQENAVYKCNNCSYVGNYDNLKCLQGCGQLSQANYHVPRDWLSPEGELNTVIVLEEQVPSDPLDIQIQQHN
jgi:hypothetical protein